MPLPLLTAPTPHPPKASVLTSCPSSPHPTSPHLQPHLTPLHPLLIPPHLSSPPIPSSPHLTPPHPHLTPPTYPRPQKTWRALDCHQPLGCGWLWLTRRKRGREGARRQQARNTCSAGTVSGMPTGRVSHMLNWESVPQTTRVASAAGVHVQVAVATYVRTYVHACMECSWCDSPF